VQVHAKHMLVTPVAGGREHGKVSASSATEVERPFPAEVRLSSNQRLFARTLVWILRRLRWFGDVFGNRILVVAHVPDQLRRGASESVPAATRPHKRFMSGSIGQLVRNLLCRSVPDASSGARRRHLGNGAKHMLRTSSVAAR